MSPHWVLSQAALVAACGGAAILADAVGGSLPVPGVDGLNFGNLTATGILGWFVWHTLTRTIPRLMADFRDEMRLERESHKEQLREIFRLFGGKPPMSTEPESKV